MLRLKGRLGKWSRAAFSAALYCLLPTAYCLLLSAYCLPSSAQSLGDAQPGRPTLRRGPLWAKQPSGTFAWLHAVYFVDGARGWAVGGRGALLSTKDGGASWQALRPPTADTLRDVFFTDELTGWLVCEADLFNLKTESDARSYLLRTADGGATWSRVELAKREPTNVARDDAAGRLLRVVFADREHGWTFGEEGTLYATSDGGDSWARQSVPTRHLLLGAHFLDARRGWLVGAGATFLYTSDGGATWRAGSLVTHADFDAGRVDAAKGDASARASAQTATRASAQATAPRVNAVSFVDERRGWAVGAAGAVYTTVNGGRSWRALASGTDADLLDVKFFDASTGWAVGAAGTLLHTRDGGETWEPESADTKHQLERLFFVNRRTAWAVGFGGTILSYVNPKAPTPSAPPALRSRDDAKRP